MSDRPCPFCNPSSDKLFFTGDLVVGLWDAFPASPGHALLVTRRHIAEWFEATPEEQAELLRAIAVAKATIEMRHRPDGYNVGINIGRAAGQTVFHLHVHIIPRYTGDVPDPRGGVRHVIPGKANYLAGVEPATDRTGDRPPALVRGGQEDPLLPHLVTLLDDASAVSIAAAFTLESGVRLVEEHLRDVLDRDGQVRIVTGDYLGVTEPQALLRLLDLQGDIRLRIFESNGVSFHPKAYIVTHRDGAGTAFVGSSNLSETALKRGVEWNYRVVHSQDRDGYAEVVDAFQSLWEHPSTRELDPGWVHEYAARRAAPLPRESGVVPEPVGPPPEPHPVQVEALAALEKSRAEGNTAGLVVLGVGSQDVVAYLSSKRRRRRYGTVSTRQRHHDSPALRSVPSLRAAPTAVHSRLPSVTVGNEQFQ